ncbi:MAG: dTDP-4-dehydrorhamnose 3,5-epimerase family protein [Chloroflexi bacterium]|nr:dTDP-4-dehydrorhamnose 3,5-epimerase family protein [Chloroflexota bacterium]
MIQGVEVKQLTRNADERGFLMEIMRKDDPIFTKFGQCYVSMNYPGVVRAWHYHQKQDDFFVVVKGMIKVGLYDMREGSPSRGEVSEFYLGDNNNIVLKIPVGVAHGYKTVGVEPSLLVNFPSEVYNREEPDEHRLPWDTDQIPFDWEVTFK